jgi:signal transduction histidine kinase
MANSGTRLIDLVSNILDMSKFEFAKMEYNFQPYDIKVITEEVIEEFKAISIKKNIPITSSISAIKKLK